MRTRTARAGRRSRGPRPGLAKPEVSRGSRRPREPAGGGATETWRGKWGGAGRGAEPRGARAGRPAGAGAERSRPLWEIGMLSQSGGGAGDPGSPAPPEAEPCWDLGWVAASRPGVWGVRNPVEWSCGPGPFHLYFSPPSHPGPPGSAFSDVGHEERGGAHYRVRALAAPERRIPPPPFF